MAEAPKIALQCEKEWFKQTSAELYAQRVAQNGTPFWNRTLSQFNPFGIFTAKSCANTNALISNWAKHNLARPKGILSITAMYGGFGWFTGVVFKNRYHLEYEYH